MSSDDRLNGFHASWSIDAGVIAGCAGRCEGEGVNAVMGKVWRL